MFNRIKAASILDVQTVLLTLDPPIEPLLLVFGAKPCAIVPGWCDGAPGATAEVRNKPANQTPVGTGASKSAEWQRGNFTCLVRHDRCWKPGQLSRHGIIYRIVPHSQSRGPALQTGQAMLTASSDIEPFDVPRFYKQPNLEVTTSTIG